VDVSCSTGCQADCPLPVVACPFGTNRVGLQASCSGSGSCLSATGSCSCFKGYAGNDCGQCAPYYLRIGTSCVFMPGAFASCANGVKDGNEEGVDCGGPNCEKPCPIHQSVSEALLPTDVIIKISISAGLALFVGVIAAFVFCQRRPKASDKLAAAIPPGLKGAIVQRAEPMGTNRSQVMPVSHTGQRHNGAQIPRSPIHDDGSTPVESWRGPSPVRKQRVEAIRTEQKPKSVRNKTAAAAWQN
jgi:Laminin EGF domain